MDPKIDNWGHNGGLLTGILVGLATNEVLESSDRDKGNL